MTMEMGCYDWLDQDAILCRSQPSLLTAVFIASDPNTNTLYLIAGAWSFCLSLLLLALARLQPACWSPATGLHCRAGRPSSGPT